ncbi:hypothetical protein EG328_010051 [Venturia inaequalis]|uniref:S-adenosyl-L-methionine-dependent methyltransferase n=1 Tax=Venturia inaequalis TaxID=5025 RepID=A0A8H3YLE2_VENIN|nr:hypothetical protein EG328_010051 [Venturia inaequalis]
MSTGNLSSTTDRERLREHFSAENTPSRWDDLWSTGTFLPWDRGTPNPALIDVLSTKQEYLGPPIVEEDGKQRRKKALVPGCGKGYDVFLFAAFGYDAYGLEGSPNAIKACEGFRKEAEGKEEYAIRDQKAGRGSVKFVLGDFFSKTWEKEIDTKGDEEEEVKFDVIYDYTFLCALEPKSRPAWSQRMYDLLHPKGNLICLEFPTYKEPSTGGPPWALPPEVYENLLPYPGEELKYNEEGYVIKEGKELSGKSMVRVAHWQPDRTHEIGKGTDWVGIWQHQVCPPRVL